MRDEEKTEFARYLRRNMTETERLLWWKLRDKRLSGWKFHRQKPVGPFVVDFACLEIRLAIEVDGATHGTPQERDYDARRTHYLETNDWRVIRFWNADVRTNLNGVLDAVHTAATEQTEWTRRLPAARRHRKHPSETRPRRLRNPSPARGGSTP